MVSRQEVIKNIQSFYLKYTDDIYLIDVDQADNNKLIHYYEYKLKEGSVFEYNYVGPTDKFGVTYHHYKIDYLKIDYSKFNCQSMLPPEVYMPDNSYCNFGNKTTSDYFGEYLWVRNHKWDSLYKEKDKFFLIMK